MRTARLLKAADLPLLPATLSDGPARYELWEGHLRVMSPPGDPHGAAQAFTTYWLIARGHLGGHGTVRTEVGVIVARDPDTVLAPDVMFFGTERQAGRRLSPEDYSETMPDLAVEVRSPSNSGPDAERKAALYLAAGVTVVWDLDPDRRRLRVFRAVIAPEEFAESDAVELPEVMPGVRFVVRELLGV